MSNVETNLIKPFPVAFSGHTLKYGIECICKIFLPMRSSYTFLTPSPIAKMSLGSCSGR